MNKHSVNISSLVILLSLISFLVEICLYYFVPQHFYVIGFAIIVSFVLSHFFLEASLHYDYNFLHGAFMTICSVAFAIILYFVPSTKYIEYDMYLLALILVNWLSPYIYCFIRDFFDRGPRFDGYMFFFHSMNVIFIVVYLLAILKQFFMTPIVPPYKAAAFGAHNFIPFMSTGNYFEGVLRHSKSTTEMIVYIIELIILFIPFGFFARVYCKKLAILFRIPIYLAVPFVLELIQYLAGIGRSDIDDYSFEMIGTLLGILVFHIFNALSKSFNKREFLSKRTTPKKPIHF